MTHDKLYVQFGAGNEAIPGWLNFDASPTLRIQKIPLLGRLLRPKLNCVFDKDILYGDIVKGLPLQPDSVDGLFCSHVFEHLSYADFLIALANSYKYLKRGGRFRIVVPDLEYYVCLYQITMSESDVAQKEEAAVTFCRETGLGIEGSRTTVLSRLYDAFRSRHYWMWDYPSLSKALFNHGFANVQKFQQGHCDDEMFLMVEREHMFGDSKAPYGLAIECVKPF